MSCRFAAVGSSLKLCIVVDPNMSNKINHKRLGCTVAMAVLLTGCATAPPTAMPLNVAMLPHDCQNRQIMLDWLQGQARRPQHRTESDSDFQRTRNEIRKKIWDIRYHCQPV